MELSIRMIFLDFFWWLWKKGDDLDNVLKKKIIEILFSFLYIFVLIGRIEIIGWINLTKDLFREISIYFPYLKKSLEFINRQITCRDTSCISFRINSSNVFRTYSQDVRSTQQVPLPFSCFPFFRFLSIYPSLSLLLPFFIIFFFFSFLRSLAICKPPSSTGI